MAKTLIGIFGLCIVVAIFVIPTPSAADDTVTTEPDTSSSPTSTPSTPEPISTTPSTPEPKPTTPSTPEPKPTTPSTPESKPTAPSTPESKPTAPSTPTTVTTAQTGNPPTEGSSTPPVTGSLPTEDPNDTQTTPSATSSLPGPCASNPCPAGSTCEERAQGYICLCLPGDFYIKESCQRAKVFPGVINWAKPFEEGMSVKTSTKFLETSDFITNALLEGFSDTGYIGSLVLELRESPSSQGRSTGGNIEASVQVIFEPTAKMTDANLKVTITNKVVCDTCPLRGTYTETPLCKIKPCDAHSTKCNSTNGDFDCKCENGFFESPLSPRVCAACPPGQKYDGAKCISCEFGYSGVNCEDDLMLILVIVASILGGFLLIALIVLPIVATKNKKKSSKSKVEEDTKPYFSHSVAKAPIPSSNGFSSSSAKEPADGPAPDSWANRIPRATTTSKWDSRTNLEMTPSNSRQNLIASGKNSWFNDNQDDAHSFSQNRPKSNPYDQVQPKSNPYDQVQPKSSLYSQVLPKSNPYDQFQPKSSLYSQVLPKSNPYAQNRATNPYAQSRGQTNPYFH